MSHTQCEVTNKVIKKNVGEKNSMEYEEKVVSRKEKINGLDMY